MNGNGKSDRPIVPKKLPNKGCGAPQSAEEVEGRGLAKGNPRQENRCRAQKREGLQSALTRIRQLAVSDSKLRFTTLWHHVYNIDRLRQAYFSVKRKASSGVDKVTWVQYGEELESNLQDLSDRLARGAYRAKPVRRVFIDKADGRKRPIGIPALEDKIVQRSTVEVMNCIYETDFLGFSYGSRPKRSAHNALDAVTVGIERKKVNWVLDADISGFFDVVDHEWLIKFVEHRIADKCVIRHIKKWLNAGVMENGKKTRSEEGTPQGGSISPLLANIYLHYVFDLWVQQWRKKQAHGDLIVVRYVDDIIVGFQHKFEAEQLLKDMRERFRKFNLELHPVKTRLIRFGRFADERGKRGGGSKPDTFDFLGFTHSCSKKRNGKFRVLRQTMRKRLGAKLIAVKQELRKRMHWPVPEVGKWLASVVTGHCRYYGVPYNRPAIDVFRTEVIKLWHKTLRRRSQKDRGNWDRTGRLVKRYIPTARIYQPYPNQRLCV